MFYRDLVTFTPLETVIQLREADNEAAAKKLVSTYVISDGMASKLVDVVIPQLRLDQPQDSKGVLIVGNYGTGKSHLMAVISAVAERAALADDLTNDRVKEAVRPIAGKFKVVRVDIGSVKIGLRDMLMGELQKALTEWGIPTDFPPDTKIPNNKGPIVEAVQRFQQKYPGMGILLVVDELLDYLRNRENAQLLRSDLAFLRELGEVSSVCAFRFIAGLQETLFENPHFANVSAELRRVKDRFEQVRIAREDISFVVEQRLLAKIGIQKDQIRKHLSAFTPLYASMAERMDEFVNLFPIHPAYLAVFQTLVIAEQRHVLKTLSTAIRSVMDQEVPEHQPGLISYDHYWQVIQDDPSLRSVDEIAEVIRVGNVLEELVATNFPKDQAYLKDMAMRIIHALGVQRLATEDPSLPRGVTPEALRDDLCLYVLNMPERNPDFLKDQVEATLGYIIKLVQGQFISHNEDNDQYYLDLKKTVDFDQKIRDRSAVMSSGELDQYFFDALRLVLNLSDTTRKPGYNTWTYELPWPGHNVTRPGYLFFGWPDERSTGQPPRDFYLCFLPLFEKRHWNEPDVPDEVTFSLADPAEEFMNDVRLYASARAMAIDSPQYRQQYNDKADAYLKNLTGWLKQHLQENLYVGPQDQAQPVASLLHNLHGTVSPDLKEMLDSVAASLLAPVFEERYPDYPRFEHVRPIITETARPKLALEAVRPLTGSGTTAVAAGVLEGLGLLDEEGHIRPSHSPYASYFVERLTQKDQGQVVNRTEIMETVVGSVEQAIENDIRFHLEPEWVAVILLALVYSGDIVLTLSSGKQLDAGSLDRALDDLNAVANFRLYQRPKSTPVQAWGRIFQGLGLPPGLVQDAGTQVQAIKLLIERVNKEKKRVETVESEVKNDPRLWHSFVFTDSPKYLTESGWVVGSDAPPDPLTKDELTADVKGWRQFLDKLSWFDIPGKLPNLDLSLSDVEDYLAYGETVTRAERLLSLVHNLQSPTDYLYEAMNQLPADHPWVQKAAKARDDTLHTLRLFAKTGKELDESVLLRALRGLKAEYVALYSQLHQQHVLNVEGEEYRSKLRTDPRFQCLEELAALDLFARSGEWIAWKHELKSLPSCTQFHQEALEQAPTCPFCSYRPASQDTALEAGALLKQLDERLTTILIGWRHALREALNTSTAQTSLRAMHTTEQGPIQEFLSQKENEATLPPGFVRAAAEALRGIHSVTLDQQTLTFTLKQGGSPCTLDELRARFDKLLSSLAADHNPDTVRVNLEL